ncbi:hypothetical protein BCE02nite_03130 [Brevibacillus centrosporus]|nr:hypothetical protein BCE02nite_03130 [Brevibacillus centrosporus]
MEKIQRMDPFTSSILIQLRPSGFGRDHKRLSSEIIDLPDKEVKTKVEKVRAEKFNNTLFLFNLYFTFTCYLCIVSTFSTH